MRRPVVALAVIAGAHLSGGAGVAAAATVNLYHPGYSAHYAFVNVPVVARTRPSAKAHRIGKLTLHTQDHTDELVGVLSSRSVKGTQWVRVELPFRPTGATGWVPRAALGELQVAKTWLKIDRHALKASVIRQGKVIWHARVGVGKAKWPTTGGRFYIRDRLVPKSRNGIYGALAFGTSARSRVLTDWPGGGFIGIHGTNQPGILPGRVSHGCVRLRNKDILALDKLIGPGTPVTIR